MTACFHVFSPFNAHFPPNDVFLMIDCSLSPDPNPLPLQHLHRARPRTLCLQDGSTGHKHAHSEATGSSHQVLLQQIPTSGQSPWSPVSDNQEPCSSSSTNCSMNPAEFFTLHFDPLRLWWVWPTNNYLIMFVAILIVSRTFFVLCLSAGRLQDYGFLSCWPHHFSFLLLHYSLDVLYFHLFLHDIMHTVKACS